MDEWVWFSLGIPRASILETSQLERNKCPSPATVLTSLHKVCQCPLTFHQKLELGAFISLGKIEGHTRSLKSCVAFLLKQLRVYQVFVSIVKDDGSGLQNA